jgi:hypothetical protein
MDAEKSLGIAVRWTVKADIEVKQDDVLHSDLVLAGSAKTNRLVAQMKDKLPIKESDSGLQAGTQKVTGADAAFRLTYPNPLAPHRFVLIYGVSTAAGIGHFKRFLSATFVPTGVADYALIDATGELKVTGLFRNRWQIEG